MEWTSTSYMLLCSTWSLHASMLVVHSRCMTRGSMTLSRALVTAITLTAGKEQCLLGVDVESGSRRNCLLQQPARP